MTMPHEPGCECTQCTIYKYVEKAYEPTECTPGKLNKNADYHVNGDTVGEIFSCPDCGLTCEV